MADGRFPFLSLILGFISNLTAYFQANLASLIFKLIFPDVAKHYQVTFATGVKRQKVGFPLV